MPHIPGMDGAVSGREMLAGLPGLVRELARGTFRPDVRPLPRGKVESAWNDAGAAGRVVFIP